MKNKKLNKLNSPVAQRHSNATLRGHNRAYNFTRLGASNCPTGADSSAEWGKIRLDGIINAKISGNFLLP